MQTSQHRQLLFVTLSLTYIATGMTTILPGPALSVLAAHTGVSLDIAGWAFTASSLGFTSSAMVAGALSSRVNPKYILLSGQAIMALMAFISPLTHSFVILLIAQFVVGVSFGLIDVSVNMVVTLAFHDRLGETLNNLHSTFGIGALVGPLLLALSIQVFHDASWAFTVGSLLALCSFFLLLRQPVSATPHKKETDTEATGILTAKVLLQMTLWLMALQLFLYVGAEVSFGDWITTAISQSAAVTLVVAAPSTTFFWLGLTVGRLAGAQVIRRGLLSESRLLYLCFYGSGLAGLIVALFPGSIWISFGFSFLVGLFYGPIYPSVMAIASRHFIHALGIISSVMSFGAGASGLVIPVMVGVIITHFGVSWGMAVPALISLLIVVPFYLTERNRPKVAPAREISKAPQEGEPSSFRQ